MEQFTCNFSGSAYSLNEIGVGVLIFLILKNLGSLVYRWFIYANTCFLLIVLLETDFVSWQWFAVFLYQLFEYGKYIFNVFAITFYLFF